MGIKFNPLLLNGFDFTSSGGGSSPTIGGPVVGGTTGSVLFVGSGSTLSQDNANFNFNGITYQLTITGNLAAATFNGYTPENLANKGIANGYAPLDGSGKVPYANLPSALMTFKGAWNPTTNTPTLINGTGLTGDTYRASVGGTSTSPIVDTWFAGDFIIYNGTIWQRSPLSDGVISVNGFTGAVVLTQGNLTDAGIDGIIITGGTNAVWGSGTSISQHVADSTHNGYLSSTDWSTFNNKQASGSYITALTGDVTASGSGSVVATLATINSNVGTFGSSTSIPTFTVNAKGLITAASGNVVIAPAGTLTGTTLAANVVNSSLTSVGTLTTLLVSGTISASNFSGSSSGTNTGDQTITLTGAVTGSGTGSFATTLTNSSVTGQALTGFVSGPNSVVLATDTVLQGLGKLQAQVSASPIASTGDINQTSFTAADNQIAPANVTGFAFANASVRSFDALVSVTRSSTYEVFKIRGIQKAASWEMSQDFTGDNTCLVFSITAAGQVQYTSTSTGSTALVKFRAIVTNV